MNQENHQESLFEKIIPIMYDYQLAKLKIHQFRAKGSTYHKSIVKQVRQANIKLQEIKYELNLPWATKTETKSF